MKRQFLVWLVLMALVPVSEARAERASVATAKAAVVAVKAVGKAAVATGKYVACPWRGLKWLVTHA